MPFFSACKINKLFLEKKENAIFFLQNDIYNIFYDIYALILSLLSHKKNR